MNSPRLKFNLFFIFRLTFFVNLLVAISFLTWAFFVRSRISKLEDTCRELVKLNVDLSSQLSYSIHYITNDIFSVSSSFASNVLLSASFSFLPGSFTPPSSTNSPSSSPTAELPPLTFSNYFEIDGVPFISVRNKYYKPGDMLLGFPVQLISPDVVQYRDRFFKVSENLSLERKPLP